MTSDHPTQVLPTTATRPNLRAPGPVPVTLPRAVARTHRSIAAVPPGLRLAALAVALVAAVGVYAVWRFFVASRTGQIIDAYAYEGAYTGRTQLWTVAEPFLDLVSNASIIMGTGTIAGIALLRRRWMVAVQAVVVIAGANITTQVLKRYVFERPAIGDDSWWVNSLPSGHTTVAASVSVALLLAVPRAARPIMAVVGTVATSAIGISTLIGRWHRPSDVVAAVFVTLVWGALACVVMTESAQDASHTWGRRRFAPRGSRTAWGVAILGTTTLLAGGIAVWALLRTARVAEGSQPFSERTEVLAYGGGAAGVLAVTALCFAVLLAFRQAVARPRSRAAH